MTDRKINAMQVMLDMDIGGAQMFVLNLARAIDRSRFNISVCCIWSGGELQREFESLDVPVYVLNKDEGYDTKIIGQLVHLFREQQTHVVHSHHLGPLMYVWPAAQVARGRRLIHTEHSFIYLRGRKFWLAKFLFGQVYRTVGVCDDVSTFITEQLRVKRAKVATIDNGVHVPTFPDGIAGRDDAARQALGYSGTDFIIGTVGRLDPIKNHERLLQAFQEVLATIPSAKLVIAGDGELRERLAVQAQRLHIASAVQFTGFRRDVAQIIAAMDLFILPSLDEGLSLALLEAMAMQRPVIVSGVGGNTDVVSDGVTGLLVSPTDTSAIAHKIVQLYNDGQTRQRLALVGYRMVSEKYSLESMVAKYQDLYVRR